MQILTVQDVLFHLPFRYEDRTSVYPIYAIKPGDRVLIEGVISDVKITGARRYLRCQLTDDGGASCDLVFFHFTKGHAQKLKNLQGSIRCFGEVRRSYAGGLEMVHPEYAPVYQIQPNGPLALSDRLSPIYAATKGMSQVVLRKIVHQCFDLLDKTKDLKELLPESLCAAFQSFAVKDALRFVHFPPVGVDEIELQQGKHPAIARLAFEELIAHQLSLQTLRHRVRHCLAPALPESVDFKKALLLALPYQLTNAQQRVVTEIENDLKQTHPMLRLVQGDVGSGKTIVACIAAIQAVEAGYQVAVMAPTEILSEQHFRCFKNWLEPLDITVAHLTGRQTAATQNEIKSSILSGDVRLIVGTHALFQKSVEFKSLGLLIIDEQHRFGVHQRLSLLEKGFKSGQSPHQLIMTATPIPRTLAMTAYADLDCSTIDELPPGRQPITTLLVANDRRDEIVARIEANCQDGKQAYWVCSLVAESDVLQCQAAEETVAILAKQLPNLRVGLVHGRLKADEKQQVMQDFKNAKVDLLVATTVVEVGVDVPNASLMVIENPERFGLAQLHQLRGRIGRGSEKSYCVLLYQKPLSNHAMQRLTAMRETQDGFKIAAYDLEMRGPGELLGARQSGDMRFRVANVVRDQSLLSDVRSASQVLTGEYPSVVPLLVKRWIGAQEKYADA